MSDERAGFLRAALFNGNGVAKKLIVALVVFSTLITTLSTAIELYTDYRRDLDQIGRSMGFIGKSYLPTLTDSVWVADEEQIQMQLDGLLRLPDIEFIGISVDGKMRWSAGKAVSQRKLDSQAPLTRERRGQVQTIGTVHVVASIDNVLARIWGRLLATLVSNAAKTLLVSGFMLLLFQYLVTRHLTHAAAFLRRIDAAAPRGEQLQLDRPAKGLWRPDILDVLTAAINGLSRALSSTHDALRQSGERLHALTRDTAAFIYEVDREGRILFANRAYPGRPARDQLEGTPLSELFPPEVQPSLAQAVERTFVDARPQHLEYTVADPAGTARAYLAVVTPIWRDDRVVSVALTAVDISDQKAAERAIRELNRDLELRVRERTAELNKAVVRAEDASRAKSEFLSHMSHELRTPMNAILGFAQIIEMSAPSERQLKWAGEIRRAGDHLLRMIEDLLDMACIEVGKVQIRIEAFDVATIVAEAAAIAQPMVEARGLQLIQECRGNGWHVMSDRLRLRQILVNLLSNATKYNREHGTVTIGCEQYGDRIRVSVHDTGIGIAPENVAKLFQRFERAGAEFGTVAGTGLGLALSKQLADLMGAGLGLSSQVGVGSVFWVDVARAQGPASGGPLLPAPASERHALEFSLLYVEDNPSNIEVIAAFLAQHPHIRLQTASDGPAALALARQMRPDIVLLDIQLPGMDGYQVLRHLRADPLLAHVPVVALTGDAMPHDVEHALAGGFDRHLAKPVDLLELLGVLNTLSRGRSAAAGSGPAAGPRA